MGESEDKAATINAIPAPTQDTGSVKLASTAEGAMTTKPEALESCAGGMAGYGPLSATKECGRGQGLVWVQHRATRQYDPKRAAPSREANQTTVRIWNRHCMIRGRQTGQRNLLRITRLNKSEPQPMRKSC